MTSSSEQSHLSLIDGVAKLVRKRVKGRGAKEAERFVRAFYARVPPDDISESRDVSGQQAVTVHAAQLRVNALGLAQQLQEGLVDLRVGSEAFVHQVQVIADRPDGGRRYAVQRGIGRQQVEEFHQRGRPRGEDVRVAEFDEPVAHAEISVQVLHIALLAAQEFPVLQRLIQ